MDNCLFCRIINGDVPSRQVYEDEHVYAFRDISPQAPVHVLVVPKEHISAAADLNAGNSMLAAKCFEAIAKIAAKEGISNAFRVITNNGTEAGQTVFHLHFHLLGGKAFSAGGLV